MWIVRLALRRPYTFVVMALLILLLGIASIKTMPTDIFPEIDIPVVTVVWQYPGLSPDQMAKQITTFSEYTISSAVDNVKNIESQTLAGVSTIRIFFQPNVRIDSAIAQVTTVSQTILRRMPPGTQPPFIIRYNASSVPILQLALGSKPPCVRSHGHGSREKRTKSVSGSTTKCDSFSGGSSRRCDRRVLRQNTIRRSEFLAVS